MRWFTCVLAAVTGCAMSPDRDTPEARAVAYLVREVPAWSRENGCFSCHNNGDGARALYLASRSGYRVPSKAIADTSAWLLRPERWDDNKGDPAFSDKRLANIQFAAALQTSGISARREFAIAAARVAGDQRPSGAWDIEPGNPIGSPVTYGTALATYMALQTLSSSTNVEGTRKAWSWFERLEARNNVAAAALVLASRIEANRLQVEPALKLLKSSQNSDGGWGPYLHSPSEPFDTALVSLALGKQLGGQWRTRARGFLERRQNADGSWPATTRPAGGDSYAQQVSTTAWVLMALLADPD